MKKTILVVAALLLLASAIGVYFLSTSPADAPVIATDTLEIASTTENVLDQPKFLTESEIVPYYNETNGYLANPVGAGPFPAVVLIHEWWGLNDNIKSLADDFAAQGYVALAVDMYNGKVATTSAEAGAYAGAVRENTDEAFSNLAAATAYLKSLTEVDGDRLASVGWCFGGKWSYEMAANDMGIDASVMYYGRFSLEDDLSMMKAHILGHFGEEDTSIAVDDVKQFEAKLSTLSGEHAVFIYPNAGHAFANEDNAEAYNDEAAKVAWKRTMDFLSRQLGE